MQTALFCSLQIVGLKHTVPSTGIFRHLHLRTHQTLPVLQATAFTGTLTSLDSAGHCTHMLSDTLWPLQVHTPMLPLHLCSFSMNMNSQAHCLVWTLLACL